MRHRSGQLYPVSTFQFVSYVHGYAARIPRAVTTSAEGIRGLGMAVMFPSSRQPYRHEYSAERTSSKVGGEHNADDV